MEKANQEAALGTSKSVALKYNTQCCTDIWRQGLLEKKSQFRACFNKEQEQLAEYLKFMGSLLYGLMRADWFCAQECNSRPFQNGATGARWLMGFIKRHLSVTVHLTEPTLIAMARRFNSPKVSYFYSLLLELIENEIDASYFYNADETCTHVHTKNSFKWE
jgi:hypothetical protein